MPRIVPSLARNFVTLPPDGALFVAQMCINRKFERYNSVLRLSVGQDSVYVEVSERRPRSLPVEYHFTPDLKLRQFDFSDTFLGAHAELYGRRLLDHRFSDTEAAPMGEIRVLVPFSEEDRPAKTARVRK